MNEPPRRLVVVVGDRTADSVLLAVGTQDSVAEAGDVYRDEDAGILRLTVEAPSLRLAANRATR